MEVATLESENALLRVENARLIEDNAYLLAVVAEQRIRAAWAMEVANRPGQVLATPPGVPFNEEG